MIEERMTFKETVSKVRDVVRPMTLQFCRMAPADSSKYPAITKDAVRQEQTKGQKHIEQLLMRYRILQIKDPGAWSSTELPDCNGKQRIFSYQVRMIFNQFAAAFIVLACESH